MDGAFRLIQKTNPQHCLETQRRSFLLGRSSECDLVVAEPHVSRVQAKVWLENGRHIIKNLGRSALRVNGRQISQDVLATGDEVMLGKTSYFYQTAAGPPPQCASEAKTLLAADPLEAPSERRLVCTAPAGAATTHRLSGAPVVLGRSQEADIVLEDPAVSRRHCVLEARAGACYARNISASNPLLVNNRPVTEARLYSGDQLKIGAWSIAFISSRRDDTRAPVQTPRRTQTRWAGILALSALLAAGYCAYRLVLVPWQSARSLAAIAAQIDAGEYAAARAALTDVMASGLSPADAAAARRLLSEAALGAARQTAQAGRLEEATAFLKEHLARHGGGAEAAPVWDQLHRNRLEMARRLEAGQDMPRALALYAAVSEDSPEFPEAQKAIHRLWLAYQNKTYQQQTVAHLLKEAEAHFAARRLLAPVNQNAYSAFQAVLALEPHNAIALRRIEQIKAHFRSEGEAFFKAGNWSKALGCFERLSLIEPEARDVREKMLACSRKLEAGPGAGEPPAERGRSPVTAADDKQRRVRQLLEESGAQSSWIMEYLFEEKPREPDAETPW